MSRPHRVRSPPFGYDPRALSRAEPRLMPPEHDEPYASTPPFDSGQNGPTFVEPTAQYPMNYREHRPVASYRAPPAREPYPPTGSAQYKILCITNINPKVSDGPMKEALMSDFSRFGDISVSICHDSGERLAYIYFRTYEEAREARHAKSRAILFDRPIEIEPIYEPKTSPLGSPATSLQASYSRRRSITPPDYYGVHGAHPTSTPPLSASATEPISQPSRKVVPPAPHHYPLHQRAVSPPPGYPYPMRYPPSGRPSPPPTGSMPYGRQYVYPEYIPHQPYSPPSHEQYRYYHQVPHSPVNPDHFPSGHIHPSTYVGYPPYSRERERVPVGEPPVARSPRSEAYLYQMEHRGYSQSAHVVQPSSHHPSRNSSSMHSSSNYHPHSNLSPSSSSTPSHHHQPTSRKSPAHLEHPVKYMSREYRREKYSSESYLNEPEEGRPSRLIFITNIDTSKTEVEMKEIFEPFGAIEEIELRKVSPDFSSALIKYSSMDCAYKAKTALSGKYLGNIKCRITYGKVSASRRLWIGGLGSTTTMADLDDEFGKYGNIINLDYISGRPYAYVEFESANQAQFATQHLRGTIVANSDRRMRIEYVDPVERNDRQTKTDPSLQTIDVSSRSRTTPESWSLNHVREENSQLLNRKRPLSPSENSNASKRVPQVTRISSNDTFQDNRMLSKLLPDTHHDSKQSSERVEGNNNVRTRDAMINGIETRSPYEGPDISEASSQSTSGTPSMQEVNHERCSNIREIVNNCPISFAAKLILRNFSFPSTMSLCSGTKSTIERYIVKLDDVGRGGSCPPVLKITQRWRLHPQPKLEEVKKRMQTGNLGMLIITSRPNDNLDTSTPFSNDAKSPLNNNSTNVSSEKQSESDQQAASSSKPAAESVEASQAVADGELGAQSLPATQSRPLKNLISYLEQKDAAGVISLSPLASEETSTPSDGSPKLLYTFPPGSFAYNLLKRRAPNLVAEIAAKEEYLLGVIVGGSEAKI